MVSMMMNRGAMTGMTGMQGGMMGTTGMTGMTGMMPAGMGTMMMPRCTIKMEKCDGGMKITCTCDDKVSCTMMQNLCTMMAGGMCTCCMMM
ncbi:MAG: hypothetical protein JO329_10400, partial [Planctomycetaceae bacterium]|nr:hypothetical protein [Planctomycetaceae bacterium]